MSRESRFTPSSEGPFFWCQKHNKVESNGTDTADCLLVGPYSTRAQAEAWPRSSSTATPRQPITDAYVYREQGEFRIAVRWNNGEEIDLPLADLLAEVESLK